MYSSTLSTLDRGDTAKCARVTDTVCGAYYEVIMVEITLTEAAYSFILPPA